MTLSRLSKFALCLLAFTAGGSAFAAEAAGVSPAADALFTLHLGSLALPVNNSMFTSWLVTLGLIVVIRLAIRRPQMVPTHSQAVVETMVEGLMNLVAPIIGPKVVKHAFPLLFALFVYILTQNWLGLLPGVGTLLVLRHGEWTEIIRPGNADMNSTIALALVAIGAWLYFIIRYAGVKFIIRDLFGNKANKDEVPAFIYYPLFLVFFFVGLLEIISMMFRPVSLSFRLYGNVFGGENLLHSINGISPWLLPLPVYGMEVLVGFVQAFVFVLLVSVYIGLICNHDGGHDHDEAHRPTAEPHGHDHQPGSAPAAH